MNEFTTEKKKKVKPRNAPDKLGKTVLNDLREADFGRTMHRDIQDIYEFYLDHETRNELADMGRVSRGLHMTGWLLKSSFLKLTPTRRIVLLISLFLFIQGILGDVLALSVGFVIILFILLLELKDKLVAQDELETGRAVQLALMPDRHPRLPGWESWLFTRPANEVGGDLVDYMPLEDDRLGFALGDVAGKGLGAALFMAKLQATLRAIAPDHENLGLLADRLNHIFCRDGLPNRFASLIYLEVEAHNNTVRVLNAGHMPPISVRNQRVRVMPKGDPALGLSGRLTYQEQQINVEPGGYLLLYSDGLTEARNEAGAFFGERRLQELLEQVEGHSAETVGLHILAEIERFIGEARPSDDLSLVVLKRLDEPPLLNG